MKGFLPAANSNLRGYLDRSERCDRLSCAAIILDGYLDHLKQRCDISSACESGFPMENIAKNRIAEKETEPGEYA